MDTLTRKERKENSCFNYNKRILLEGYLFGRTAKMHFILAAYSSSVMEAFFVCPRISGFNSRKSFSWQNCRIFEKNSFSSAVEFPNKTMSSM